LGGKKSTPKGASPLACVRGETGCDTDLGVGGCGGGGGGGGVVPLLGGLKRVKDLLGKRYGPKQMGT